MPSAASSGSAKSCMSSKASAARARRAWRRASCGSALHAVDKYLRGQAAWLVNYAKRYRAGLRVGTSITEGTANFLVNRRMNKSQQMRWSRRGADLLLQVRCAVYNGTLGPGSGIDLSGSPMQTRPLPKRHDPPISGQSPERSFGCHQTACMKSAIRRGDQRKCVSCGAHIQANIRSLMVLRANNPTVMAATPESNQANRQDTIWPSTDALLKAAEYRPHAVLFAETAADCPGIVHLGMRSALARLSGGIPGCRADIRLVWRRTERGRADHDFR